MYKLREILKDNNIKNTDVAEILNIKSLSTVSLKINGKAEFTAKEASILKNYINITNNNGNLIICGIEKLFTYTNSITNNLYQVHDEDKVFELINI